MFIFLPFLTSNQSNATSRNESSRKFSVETVLPSVLQCGRFKCRRRKAGFSSVWPWPASNYISESRLGPKVDSTNIERTNRAGWTSRQGQSRTIEPSRMHLRCTLQNSFFPSYAHVYTLESNEDVALAFMKWISRSSFRWNSRCSIVYLKLKTWKKLISSNQIDLSI